jgi:hypothetical protein
MSLTRWLQDHPVVLERAYRFTEAAIRRAEPLLRWVGFDRLAGLFVLGERLSKELLFDCQMCGMCNLRGTGMTCPMTCPKNLRNGPCGGVRPDGRCEVKPEMDCVWVLAWKRAPRMSFYGDRILCVHPPVDRALHGSSAWLNMLDGRDAQLPHGWELCSATDDLIPVNALEVLGDGR